MQTETKDKETIFEQQQQERHQLLQPICYQTSPSGHDRSEPTKEQETDQHFTHVPLENLLRHFPNLPSFIFHSQFENFARVWVQFQQAIQYAKIPEYRNQVLQELLVLTAQLKQYAEQPQAMGVTNPEAQSDQMKSAFLQLKDKIDLTLQIMHTVEHSHAWFEQDPKAALAAMATVIFSTRRQHQVDHLSMALNNTMSPQSGYTTVAPLFQTSSWRGVSPSEQIRFFQQQQHQHKSITASPVDSAYTEFSVPTPELQNISFLTVPSVSQTIPTEYLHFVPSFPPSKMDLQLPNGSIPPPHTLPMADATVSWSNAKYQSSIQPEIPSFSQAIFGSDTNLSTPIPEQWDVAANYFYPETLDHFWSSPVTPPSEIPTSFSFPISPCVERDNVALNETLNKDAADTTMGTWITYATSATHDSYAMRATNSEMDPVLNVDKNQHPSLLVETEDGDRYNGCRDEGVPEENDDNHQSTSHLKADSKSHMLLKTVLNHTKRFRAPRQYLRRTATSYDPATTRYLKSIFFSIYSKRDKLTKEERRQIQQHTGLKPRNITYWFSNHKRRFQRSLFEFRKAVEESGGGIKTYDDFLCWQRKQSLPEEMLELDGQDYEI